MREGNEGQMFDSLSDRLGDVFGKLRGRGALTEADVRAAMREVRIALLEADVAPPVVRSFVDQVTELAVGQNVQIGRASGRERVCQYRVDLGSRRIIKKKHKKQKKY